LRSNQIFGHVLIFERREIIPCPILHFCTIANINAGAGY
jgi:hypothetical protein